MADTNLYKILSGLYTGLRNLNTKSDAKDDYISGIIGENYTSLSSVQDRLKLLEAGTSAASGVLTIAGKTYTPLSSVEVLSDDIIANVKTDLAADATGLAGAADVYANDMFLSGKIDDIASSFITDATGADALQLGKDGQTITGAILVDGTTIINASTGLKSGLKLASFTPNSTDYVTAYRLVDAAGTPIADSVEINIPKDQFLSTAVYTPATESLDLTFVLPEGSPRTVSIPVSGLVHEYEGANGVDVAWDGSTLAGKTVISGVVDHDSENFLTVGAGGFKLSGVQAAINAANSDALSSLHELSGKVEGAFVADKVTVGTADGITASEYGFGGATLSATPAATTLATEAAVKAADDALKAELSGAISGAYDLDEIVIGTGTGLKASDYKLGNDDDTYTDTAPDAKKVMTEASFFNYAHTALSGLATEVDALVAEIN